MVEIVGGDQYATLGEAIAALTGGETIKLLANYTAAGNENLTFTKNATLDLGEFELTLPAALLGAKAFEVADGAAVSFENGTITMGDKEYGLQVYGAATVSCTMTKLVNTTQGPIFDIYGKGTTSANGGTVTVVDGAYIESDADVFRHKKNGAGVAAQANIYVTGGTLKTTHATSYGIFNGSIYLHADDVAVITGGTFLGRFEQTEKWGGMTLLGADAADARFDTTATATATARLATGYEFVDAGEGLWKVQAIPSFDVTFTKNNDPIADSTTNVLRDTVLTADMIPVITDAGAWDVNPTNAIITCATNFNFTVKSADPVDPETPKHYDTTKEAEDAAKEINDNKATMIKTPDGADPADYTELFTAVVKGTDVVVELNQGGTNALETAAANIETAVADKLGNIAAATAGSSVEVTVTEGVKNGFWYGVAATAELTAMGTTEPTEWAQAKNGSVTIKATKPTTGNAAFFQTRAKVK